MDRSADQEGERRFKAWTKDAASASSALSAWSVADSRETQDIMVSLRACNGVMCVVWTGLGDAFEGVLWVRRKRKECRA